MVDLNDYNWKNPIQMKTHNETVIILDYILENLIKKIIWWQSFIIIFLKRIWINLFEQE